jgi:prepilin-type N-terminal cleavage/methylation domain-containing protein
MKSRLRPNAQRGFTLVEILTAGVILAISVMGVAAFLNKSNELDTQTIWRGQALRAIKSVMGEPLYSSTQFRLSDDPPFIDDLPDNWVTTDCPFQGPSNYTTPSCTLSTTKSYVTPTLAGHNLNLARIEFRIRWSGEQISLVKYYAALPDGT